jgi:hypothetical protein
MLPQYFIFLWARWVGKVIFFSTKFSSPAQKWDKAGLGERGAGVNPGPLSGRWATRGHSLDRG